MQYLGSQFGAKPWFTCTATVNILIDWRGPSALLPAAFGTGRAKGDLHRHYLGGMGCCTSSSAGVYAPRRCPAAFLRVISHPGKDKPH